MSYIQHIVVWENVEEGCSSWQILEENAAEKYYLSPAKCTHILHRHRSVEIAKLSHIMVSVYEVDAETLKKLHQKCVEEVKRINGAIWFEDVYRYQNGEE